MPDPGPPLVDPYALPMPDLGLLCRSCDYNLNGVGEHRCPECGRPFSPDDYLPEGAFPPLYVDGEPVRPDDELIALLRTHGIVVGSQMNAFDEAFGFKFGVTQQPAVTVPRDDFWAAVDLVVRHRRDLPLPPPPQADEPKADWVCKGCGEENPGTFDVCWQCEAERG